MRCCLPFTLAAWSALAILFGPLPVRGADEDQAPAQNAEEPPDAVVVVITAERAEEPADETAAAVGLVDRDAIRQRAPADAAELLGAVPGVDVQRMSPAGYGANVSIRGSSDFKPGGFGNRVLVLLDGRPVNSPDTHGVDWASLPLFDLERVEVLRGPASALYGSTALGGVVQLFTRRPRTGAELLLSKGFADLTPNFDSLAASASDAGEEYGWRLSGWLSRYAGLQPPGEGGGLRHNSDADRWGLRATGDWAPGADHRLSAEVGWLASAGGNPGFEGTSLESRSRRFDRGTLGLRLGHEWRTGVGLRLSSDLFYNRYSARVTDPDGGRPSAYDTDRLGLRSLGRFLLWERLVNIAGLELELQRVLGDVYQPLDGGAVGVLTAAGFWQGSLELGAGFEATAGLRLDGAFFSTYQRHGSLSPKLRLAYRPDDRTVVWVAANRGFRTPSVGELYLRYETLFGLSFQGNPELAPEVVWAFELGARRRFWDERLRLELVGFWNEGSDTIEFDYRTLPVTARNLKGTRILGAEASAALEATAWLRLSLMGSLLDARSLEDDSRLLYRPFWKAAAEVRLHGERWALALRAEGVGERLYDDFLEAELTSIPRRSLGAYWLLGASFSWRFASGFEARAVMRNALDAAHEVVQDYPPPGREWLLELRLPLGG